MNNERYNQIIDEAYENYKKISNNFQLENPIDDLIIKTLKGEMIKIETEDGDDYRILSKEEFINKCKTDPEFSKKWGLKIEERELSEGERLWICSQKHHIRFGTNDGPPWYSPDNPDRDKLKWMTESQRGLCDYKNIPTKLITITYKDEKIEVYE